MTTALVTEPWLRRADEAVALTRSDLESGLGEVDAAGRLAAVGPNQLDEAPRPPTWRRLLVHFASPLVYLLVAAVVVSLAAWIVDGREGIPYEAAAIAAIVLLNAILGHVQEARAEEAVAALKRMSTPTASVLRAGTIRPVPATDVVPGDVLLLEEGDAVAADARIVEAAALQVAEAALTGESEAVLKGTEALSGTVGIGDRSNMVFAGTSVTRGRGRAVVTATGMSTELGRIAQLLEGTAERATPLQAEVARIGRILGIGVVAIAAVVVATILATSEVRTTSGVVEVLLVGVSLAVAAVPEGLPAILSVVLALGVMRMARENAVVKKLASVETLGSASVICTDKTGTLTRNEMTIVKVVTPSGQVTISGTGYEPVGTLVAEQPGRLDPSLLEEIQAVIGGGSLASNAVLGNDAEGRWVVQGDPTEGAFLVAERKLGLADARAERFERVGEVPFTSERRLMSTLSIDLANDGEVAVITKGAPDVLLARCTHERAAGALRPLTDARRRTIASAVAGLADEALRPLAVAYRPLTGAGSVTADESLEHGLAYLGTVGIYDPPRDEAAVAIAEAHRAGIRVVLMTGDHPRTAVRIARDLGIASSGDDLVTGPELDRLDDEALFERSRDASVFARVAPEHKLRVVAALHADGQVVAMTGDGVNDAPALKSADIGVAMGIAGTEVAKEASDMILMDDDFATIVTAVREGRAIFSNIRGFLRFLLSSNVGEVLTVFAGVVLAPVLGISADGDGFATPLLATQILWINLLTDSAPALALGVDPPGTDLMAQPPRRSSDRVIDTAMLAGVLWVGTVMALATLIALDLGSAGGLLGGGGSLAEARTMAFTTLVLAQLFNCLNARSDRSSAFGRLFTNRLLWLAIGLSLVLQFAVVSVGVLRSAFGTTHLDPDQWLVCIGLASCVLWLTELRKLALRAAGR